MRDRRCCESYKLFDLVDKRHGKRMVQRETVVELLDNTRFRDVTLKWTYSEPSMSAPAKAKSQVWMAQSCGRPPKQPERNSIFSYKFGR